MWIREMPRRWRVQPRFRGDDGWRERTYYAVVKSYRDDKGRPRHKTVLALGTEPTPLDRANLLREEAGAVRERVAGLIRSAEQHSETAARSVAELETESSAWQRQTLEWRIEHATERAEHFRTVAASRASWAVALERQAGALEALQKQIDAGDAEPSERVMAAVERRGRRGL
jgi:hypothetical protein